MDSWENTLITNLGMELVELSADRAVMTMPVDGRTCQPLGFLHGGASAALAETVACIGASGSIDMSCETIVGVEINANHMRSKAEGIVTAVATPLKKGRTLHVWQVEIVDEKRNLICASRCTMMIKKL